jgi:CTP synthase
MKTKPTQHSVKELRSLGIQPNILVVRTEQPVSQGTKDKLAQFCDVAPEAVIESLDVDTLYSIPLNLQKQGMDQIVCDYLKIDAPAADMTEWQALESKVLNLKKSVRIALVGKYVELPDAYLSVVEALKHAGFADDADIEIDWVNAAELTHENVTDYLQAADGILVPGGFGDRGIEGKIEAIRYARENDVPFLGICLGMQLACVEFARNVVGLEGAHSAETDPETPYNIIDLMADQENIENLGGTLRLGLYPCQLKPGTKTATAYHNEAVVQERHRHRYEFNNEYREQFEANGLVFSGVSPDNRLVEIVEFPENKFFVACQFHPELISRPNRPQRLIQAFVDASLENK